MAHPFWMGHSCLAKHLPRKFSERRAVSDRFTAPAFSSAGSENHVVLNLPAFLFYGDIVHLPCNY